MATRTVAAGGGNWNTAATWQEGVVPTSADDVVTNGTSSGTLTVDASLTCACRSLTIANSVALTFAASSTVNIGDASGGVLNLTGSGAVTVSGGQINMVSTSSNGGAGWGVTSAGNTLTAIAFNGVGGKWVLQDALTVTGRQITLTSGSFFGNAKSIACGVFASTGTNTRTLDITNCSVTCTAGSGTNGWSFALANGLTFVATGSTITLSAASVTLNHASGNGSLGSFGTVVFSGSGQAVVNASATFVNLTRTGTASKSDSFVPGQNIDITVTGTLTLGGNTVQGVNRLGVWPINGTPGTLRTIACAGAAVVISGDVDFMDIAISGSPSWTNAGSAFVGDALGNGSLITTNRTSPLTLFRVGAGGNWSASNWSLSSGGATGQRVPLPQDAVLVNANSSGTVTADMPRLGADVDFTGFAGTFSVSAAFSSFGSWTNGSAMSFANGSNITLAGRGSHTITSNGKTIGSSSNVAIGGPGGTYTLQDAVNVTTNSLSVSDGTFTTNNQSATCGTFSAESARTVVLNLGTSIFTLMTTATTNAWSTTTSFTTLNGSTSTIVIAVAGTNTRTIRWGSTGTQLGTVTYTVANSPGTLLIHNAAQARTFAALNVGSGRGLTVFAGATITITSAFNVNGVANGYLYLPAVSGNYVSIPDSAALSPTGDMTLLTRVALDDWTPANGVGLLSKYTGVAATTSFMLYVHTTGAPRLYHSDGATINSINSTASPVIADGATLWVLVSRRNSDGRVQFFTASGAIANPVASDFTQLGADVVLAAGVSMADTATEVEVGAFNGGVAVTSNSGQYYRAQMYNGVFSTAAFGGTKVFDADFTRSLASSGWLDAAKTQFAESSVNAATVTLNGTLAQVGDGRVVLNSSTPGSAATVTKPAATAARFVDYVSIKDSTATSGLWVDGPHYANVSGNTGWVFADATQSSAETGTTAEGSSSADALSSAETATGVEGSGTIGAASSDSSSAADAQSLAAAASSSESGSEVEGGSAVASVSSAELGSGVDVGFTPVASLSSADSAVGVDGQTTPAVAMSSFDVGAGFDAQSVTAALLGIELGIAAEDSSLATLLTDSDLPAGIDNGTVQSFEMPHLCQPFYGAVSPSATYGDVECEPISV